MQIFYDIFLSIFNKQTIFPQAIIKTFCLLLFKSMLQKFSSREKKQLIYWGLFLASLLLLWIVFAPNRGVVALYKAKEEITRLQKENRRLAQENKVLQEEINKLQDDPAYLEEKARKEYGMLKENEVLYIIKKK